MFSRPAEMSFSRFFNLAVTSCVTCLASIRYSRADLLGLNTLAVTSIAELPYVNFPLISLISRGPPRRRKYRGCRGKRSCRNCGATAVTTQGEKIASDTVNLKAASPEIQPRPTDPKLDDLTVSPSILTSTASKGDRAGNSHGYFTSKLSIGRRDQAGSAAK